MGNLLRNRDFRNYRGARMVRRRAAGCLFQGRGGFGLVLRCGWRGQGGIARGSWNWRAGNGGRCVFQRLGRCDGFDFGFDRVFVFFGSELAAKFQEAVEIFDSATMEALGLGLKSKKRGGDFGLPGEAIEPESEPVGAVLFERDLNAGCEFGSIEDVWVGGAGHRLIETVDEESGFEGVHAEH